MTSQTPVWFITAASSGFGHYLALEALSRGHHVIASARNASSLTSLASAGATTLALDVTAPLPTLVAAADQAVKVHGYITHLVNAAGYCLIGAVEETSPEEDLATFQTNVLGTLNVCKAFLPHLRAATGQRVVCNFGSIGSWFGAAGCGLYCATKWAVSGLTESLRDELAPFGIAATVAEPGYFRTGFLKSGAAVQSKQVIEAYAETAAGDTREGLSAVNGQQLGDVKKGCKVLVDVLTATGSAQGKEVPMRVALGSDSAPAIRDKIEKTMKLLDEREGEWSNTDHE